MQYQATRFSFLLVAFLFLFTSTTNAQVYKTEKGTAEFTSSVPLHTFTGTSDKLIGQVNLAESTIDFYVDVNSLKTGNKKRDKDMRITLESKEFPFAEFFGKLASPFDPAKTEKQPAIVKGKFTIHGVSQEVEIEGTLQSTPKGLHVEANWDLNLKDYDIVPPSLLIVKVDEVQKIRIDALLAPAK